MFETGRSWQTVASLPLRRVTGLIITPLLPSSVLFCLNPLLLHFSPTPLSPYSWSDLTSSSHSLIHLASNPSSPPFILFLLLSTPSHTPLLRVQQDLTPVGASPSVFHIALLYIPNSGLMILKHQNKMFAGGAQICKTSRLKILCPQRYHSGFPAINPACDCQMSSKTSAYALFFPPQVRSRTSARGRAASGDSPGATS